MLDVRDLWVSYGSGRNEQHAVRGVSFRVEKGQFYTLLGPSGCGKTSTLRAVAGLESPKAGVIAIGESVVFSSSTRVIVPPNRREVGMVFQSYAIWPHMSVLDNVTFPLTHGRKRLKTRVARDRGMWALELVQLQDYARRPAPNLSGGQQQRVALARALALEPEVLLLDEPLSNLDARLRAEMRREITAVVRRVGITSLYVTHDQLEALSMSDIVSVMRGGIVEQVGTPAQVYARPSSTFVAQFLGRTNFVPGTVSTVSPDGVTVATSLGEIASAGPFDGSVGDEVLVGFRPESASLVSRGQADPARPTGRIVSRVFAGATSEYYVEIEGQELLVESLSGDAFPESAEVTVRVRPEACYLFPASPEPHPQSSARTDADIGGVEPGSVT